MILNLDDLRSKILGCWMGKNIGGTLGAPFEWLRQTNHVEFYTQPLAGDPLPNDDLDIQILWLLALEEKGVAIDAHTLADYWVLNVSPHWGEYGTSKINMRSGLVPPLCGLFHNPHKDSCGAFIRSEIWACLAPGFPALAARYAYEDAILDHGDGEGVFGEVFCAALQSAAFVEKDLATLIDIGLSYIPGKCGVAKAVREAVSCHGSGKTWQEARHSLLAQFRGLGSGTCSAEDRAEGFAEGPLGWDAPSNIGIVIIALLYGGDDFGRTVCTAVNCGEDTDCTAATAGAIWGILRGIEAIPRKWAEPVGRKIKVATLNVGEFGNYGNRFPADIDNLTDRLLRLMNEMAVHHRLPLELSSARRTELPGLTRESLMAGSVAATLYEDLGRPVFRFPFFTVAVDSGGDPTIRDGIPKTLRIHVRNTGKVQANLHIRWHAPDSWRIHPAPAGLIGMAPAGTEGHHRILEFQLQTARSEATVHRLALELAVDSRPTTLLVPVTLLSGNLM